jgi:BASS family bile acid:Na+ symporter
MLTPLETALIAAMLIVLMFGMGASLTLERFRDVLRRPRAFAIGTCSQFVVMPLLAYGLARGLALPDEAALGLVVMGMCPGGTTSNLYAHLARADVALSIAMTAASKLLGVVAMPICLYLYARPFTDSDLPMPYGEVVKTLVVLLVPVAIAMGLRKRFGERFAARAERVGSIAGVLVLVALVTLSLVRNAHLFATISGRMYLAAFALGAAGIAFGATVSRLCGLSRAEQRTVAFETGVQNSPLCFALLVTAFPGPSQLELLKLPLLYALFVLVTASGVTLLYRRADRGRALVLGARGVDAPVAEEARQ